MCAWALLVDIVSWEAACILIICIIVPDAQSVAWLERTLAAFKGTVVAVTHDR